LEISRSFITGIRLDEEFMKCEPVVTVGGHEGKKIVISSRVSTTDLEYHPSWRYLDHRIIDR
jgi:hypothetical protein